jgi:hypothetical protein
MKKLLLQMLAVITLFKLLILPHYTSTCLAADLKPHVQIGVTTDLLSNDKPVTGVLGVEIGPARITSGVGYAHRGESAFDLIARSKDGIYAGVGLFTETANIYETVMSSDTTLTSSHPGKGKGKGLKKKSRKGGKVIQRNTFRFSGEDYSMYPSMLLGVAGRRTFFESRLIFGTNDVVSGQASFGVRF